MRLLFSHRRVADPGRGGGWEEGSRDVRWGLETGVVMGRAWSATKAPPVRPPPNRWQKCPLHVLRRAHRVRQPAGFTGHGQSLLIPKAGPVAQLDRHRQQRRAPAGHRAHRPLLRGDDALHQNRSVPPEADAKSVCVQLARDQAVAQAEHRRYYHDIGIACDWVRSERDSRDRGRHQLLNDDSHSRRPLERCPVVQAVGSGSVAVSRGPHLANGGPQCLRFIDQVYAQHGVELAREGRSCPVLFHGR